MATCEECGKPIDGEPAYCRECGDMLCPRCARWANRICSECRDDLYDDEHHADTN